MWTTTCPPLTCKSTVENVSDIVLTDILPWGKVTDFVMPQIVLFIDFFFYLLFVYNVAPMGSISSMEVNVDVLEQMDLMDVSDQEALDVFLNSGSGTDEEALASPPPGELVTSESKQNHCPSLHIFY